MAGELLREAYPLWWPDHQPRTRDIERRSAHFKAGLVHARDELLEELRRLGTKDVVISSNIPVRKDGLPSADAREPQDPGVAVWFDRRRRSGEWTPVVIACDSYRKAVWNLRAVGVTIEALRAIERHGSSAMLEQAFTGFAALPPRTPEVAWWETLGISRDAPLDAIKAAYWELARLHHPDRGGDAAKLAAVNLAHTAALAARGG